jgi:hypothetical protein
VTIVQNTHNLVEFCMYKDVDSVCIAINEDNYHFKNNERIVERGKAMNLTLVVVIRCSY